MNTLEWIAQNTDQVNQFEALLAKAVQAAETLRIRHNADRAVIAGWFCVDYITRRIPKDVDIYLFGNFEDEFSTFEENLPGSGSEYGPINSIRIEKYSDISKVSEGYDRESEEFAISLAKSFGFSSLGVDVMLTRAKTVEELLSEFDIDVCMIAIDPNVRSHIVACEHTATPQAIYARSAKVINRTFNHEKHVARYREKGFSFPEETIIKGEIAARLP